MGHCLCKAQHRLLAVPATSIQPSMAHLPAGNDGPARCNCRNDERLPLRVLRAAVGGVGPDDAKLCLSPPYPYE